MFSSLKNRQKSLMPYINPYRIGMSGTILLLFLSVLCQLLNPQIFRRFIDTSSASASLYNLLFLVLLFLGIALLQQMFLLLANIIIDTVSKKASASLQLDLIKHCSSLETQYFFSRSPGELVERLDGDVVLLANLFSQLFINLFLNFILSIGVIFVLFFENWMLGVTSLAVSLFFLLSSVRLTKLSAPLWKLVRSITTRQTGYVEQILSAAEDIHANNGGNYVLKKLHRFEKNAGRLKLRARLLTHNSFVISRVLYIVSLIFGLGVGLFLYRRGSATIGTVYLLSYYSTQLTLPLDRLAIQLTEVQSFVTIVLRITELFSTQPHISNKGKIKPSQHSPKVRFSDVKFGYQDGPVVLSNISFTVGPRETLFIIGKTGSGKSTLIQLLLRLVEPQNGVILLNEENIRELDSIYLRSTIGYVGQNVDIFHASLRDNITLFLSNIPDEAIIAAITDLGLRAWLESIPAGLNTMVTPLSLSAGEAQLIALTRVLLKNPTLVILDEVTSRLDPGTRYTVNRAIRRLIEPRTAIIVTHQIADISADDNVLLIESGRIVEHERFSILLKSATSQVAALVKLGIGTDSIGSDNH